MAEDADRRPPVEAGAHRRRGAAGVVQAVGGLSSGVVEQTPPDVVISRSVRVHTRALATLAGVCVAFAIIGIAALSLAGDDLRTPPITAGLSLLAVGQLCALGGAAIAGLGLASVLREVGEPGSGASVEAVRANRPRTAVRTTASRFALLMRVTVAACVLAVTAWAVIDSSAILGAVVGALVTLQLGVALALLRVHVLRSG